MDKDWVMADAFDQTGPRADASAIGRWNSALANAAKAAPPLLYALRLWAAMCLALFVAFWLELDNPFWAGTSAAIVCQLQLGASLRKGWFRMIGTVVGATAIVLLTAAFPQDRGAFMVGLALWGAACALAATLLRNFAAYAAALAGYTAAIVASDQLGAVGGANGDAFMLAITRVSEIWIGIVCAGIVLAGTDFGHAPRRLAGLFAGLSAEIASRFAATLTQAGPAFAATQPVRRELVRRAIALDPVIDEAIGESSGLRYHSPMLQSAVEGLLAALAGWRACPTRRLVSRQTPCCSVCRPSFGQHRYPATHQPGAAILLRCVGSVRPPRGSCSPCRPPAPRCGCLPTRPRKCWLVCAMRSTGWHSWLAIQLADALAGARRCAC